MKLDRLICTIGSFSLLLVMYAMAGCNTEEAMNVQAKNINLMDSERQRRELAAILPADFAFINGSEDAAINKTPFNAAIDGLETKNRFTGKFAKEISDVQEVFHKLFTKHGEFGSLDRYYKGLESDWWIDDDFYSTSRVLYVDILNPNILTANLIQEIREQLHSLEHEWMILLDHDNSFDSRGQFSTEEGEYRIWITKDRVRIYLNARKILPDC